MFKNLSSRSIRISLRLLNFSVNAYGKKTCVTSIVTLTECGQVHSVALGNFATWATVLAPPTGPEAACSADTAILVLLLRRTEIRQGSSANASRTADYRSPHKKQWVDNIFDPWHSSRPIATRPSSTAQTTTAPAPSDLARFRQLCNFGTATAPPTDPEVA